MRFVMKWLIINVDVEQVGERTVVSQINRADDNLPFIPFLGFSWCGSTLFQSSVYLRQRVG